jgi:hypothetical protein
MPRVTRAQLRAQAEGGPQIIHDDFERSPTTEHHEYDPFSTEVSNRPPLAEIYASSTPGPELVQAEQEPFINNNTGLEKGKSRKKNKLDLVLPNNENCPRNTGQEVLEDERHSDTSSASGVAAQGLRKDEPVPETFQTPTDTARSRTPLRAAAKEANMSLSRSLKEFAAVPGLAAKTPKFDPVVHTEMSSTGQAAKESVEDSFVGSIKKRTPARMVESRDLTGDGPDSFVEDIISRSPSKYAARIEDSVEAMDALEEAIEQVSEELPKDIGKGLGSPVQTRTPKAITPRTTVGPSLQKSSAESSQPTRKVAGPAASATSSASTTTTSVPGKAISHTAAPSASSARPQPRTPAGANLKRPSLSAKVVASAGHAEPAQPKAARPPTTTAASRTSSTALSTSKPGFVPTKSAKPPTKSTFTLPGAAVSAKLKAQREERLKKQEAEAEAEAARKRTEFKARPVPKAITAAVTGKGRNSSILPRETAASKARMSMMAAKEDEDGKENAGPASRKVVGGSAGSVKGASSAARKSGVAWSNQSGLSVTKTRTDAYSATGVASRADKSTVPANSSARRRNTTAYTAAPLKTRRSSVQTRATLPGSASGCEGLRNGKPTTASAMATTTTATSKGKEVFSRGKIAEDDLLKQKREKEEAARRARAEAAERGRLASREWAERQRKRKFMMMGMEGEGKAKRGEDGKAAMLKDAGKHVVVDDDALARD